MTLQIRACNTNAVLKAISLPPSHTEQSGEVARLDTYIRQLKLIEVDDTTLFEAASDFLRAKTDKIEWAQRGLVNEQSFEDYYDALYRTWVNQNILWDCNTEQTLFLAEQQCTLSVEMILNIKNYKVSRLLPSSVAEPCSSWQIIPLMRLKLDGTHSI